MNPPDSLSIVRIFLAAPSDVEVECSKVYKVVNLLSPLAESVGVELKIKGWRQAVPNAGRPEKEILNQLEPTKWDVFIGILFHRFGTRTGATNRSTAKEYLSGTEEEFRKAYSLWKHFKRPRVMLYRKISNLPYEHDADQFNRVKEFFKELEDVQGKYRTLYQKFDTAEDFGDLLLDNLQRLLIDYRSQVRVEPRTAGFVQPAMTHFQVEPILARGRAQKPRRSSRNSRSTNQQ